MLGVAPTGRTETMASAAKEHVGIATVVIGAGYVAGVVRDVSAMGQADV